MTILFRQFLSKKPNAFQRKYRGYVVLWLLELALSACSKGGPLPYAPHEGMESIPTIESVPYIMNELPDCPPDKLSQCISERIANSPSREFHFPVNRTIILNKPLLIPAHRRIVGNATLLTTTNHEGLMLIQGSNVEIIGFGFVSQAQQLDWGSIALSPGVDNVVISGCRFEGRNSSAGVLINNPDLSNITVSGNFFLGTHYGVLVNTTNFPIDDLGNLEKHPKNIVIEKNYMQNLMADGININSPIYEYNPYNSGIEGVSASDIVIRENVILDSLSESVQGFCITIAGATNVKIYGNHLSGCRWNGIHIEDFARNITVANNVIENINGSSNGAVEVWRDKVSGVWVLNSSDVYILGNTFMACGESAIVLTWDDEGHTHDVAISGNDFGEYGNLIFAYGPPLVDLKVFIGRVPGFGSNLFSGMHPEVPSDQCSVYPKAYTNTNCSVQGVFEEPDGNRVVLDPLPIPE